MKRASLWVAPLVLVACSAPPDDGPAAATDEALSRAGYTLPWAVGEAHAVGQGEGGVLPGGRHSDHTEVLCNGAGQCGQLMIHALDFSFDEGEPVRASNDGVVRRVYDLTKPGDACFHGDGNTGRCAGKENSVVVGHDDGLETQYLHFSKVLVHVGQRVTRGETLGLAGSTGQSSGPHLHFQVQRPCGATMCQSVKISFADGVGLPKVGSHPIRSYDGASRCWSDALGRFVHHACIEKPGARGTWNECRDGAWSAVDAAAGETCAPGAPVYGYCTTETGDAVPARTCHAFPKGGGAYDWKQCGRNGAWVPGVFEYAASPLGGKLGECTSVR